MHHPRRAALLSLPCALLVCCLTERAVVNSEFPPPEFYLEVRTTETTADGLQHTQRFQVWKDGFTVYREADRSLDVPGPDGLRLPVFHRICAYGMGVESTRALSRLLYNSGLSELQSLTGDLPEPRGKVISLSWRHLDERTVQAHGQVYGQTARVLHVINSFLPETVRFELPLMTGEPEPSHLASVPELANSLADSLAFHETLVKRFPDDLELMLNAFALAHVQDRRDLALELLERIEAFAQGDRIYPEGTGPDLPERLRRLF